jgi:hypothetical protein
MDIKKGKIGQNKNPLSGQKLGKGKRTERSFLMFAKLNSPEC